VQASSASQKRNKFKGAHVFSQAAGHPATQVNGQIKQSRGRPCSHAAAMVCAGKGGSHAGGSPSLRSRHAVSIPDEGRAPKDEMLYVFIILIRERQHRVSVGSDPQPMQPAGIILLRQRAVQCSQSLRGVRVIPTLEVHLRESQYVRFALCELLERGCGHLTSCVLVRCEQVTRTTQGARRARLFLRSCAALAWAA
jgi:hypothetical protein